MIKKILIPCLLMLALFLAACGAPAADLSGEWKLSSLNGQATLQGSTVTAKFENGQVSGSTGCNSYGGEYRLDGAKLSFSNMVQTEMACMDPEGVMDQEAAFGQALSQSAAFTLENDTLRIQNAAGETILEFTR